MRRRDAGLTRSPSFRGSAGAVAAARPRALPDLEVALRRIVAVFNLVNAPAALMAFTYSSSPGATAQGLLITAAVLVPLLVDAVAAATGRGGRGLWAVSAAAYLAAVLLLPALLSVPLDTASQGVRIVVLVTAMLQLLMATGSLRAIALSGAAVLACLLVEQVVEQHVPLLAAAVQVLLVAPYSVLLATVITVLRRAAARTQQAQQASLAKVTAARFDDITESERVRTDALVHDTVLTTLLQAAGAADHEDTARAERMARNALRVLAHVRRTRDLGAGVRLGTVLATTEHEMHALLPEFRVLLDDRRLEDLLLPSDAIDALCTAMAEAMDNAVRHARAGRRTMRLSPLGPDGVRVSVEDDGLGFDYPDVSGAGIRERILKPLMLVEGRPEITTAPGRGTSVQLHWGSVSLADVRPIESRLGGASA